MTGIIAGAYTTFARIATDSYLSTAEGDGSNGMKPSVRASFRTIVRRLALCVVKPPRRPVVSQFECNGR
jgi:hypothetical protein